LWTRGTTRRSVGTSYSALLSGSDRNALASRVAVVAPSCDPLDDRARLYNLCGEKQMSSLYDDISLEDQVDNLRYKEMYEALKVEHEASLKELDNLKKQVSLNSR